MPGDPIGLINFLLRLLSIAILVRGVLTWIDPFERNAVARALYDVTEPILAPIRRLVPPVGGTLDFSW
jgi:YggT family protein